MLFFRPKDILDVERMVQLGAVDTDFVRDALIDIVGADDARVSRWNRLAVPTAVDDREDG
jgi:hypothetical protein